MLFGSDFDYITDSVNYSDYLSIFSVSKFTYGLLPAPGSDLVFL